METELGKGAALLLDGLIIQRLCADSHDNQTDEALRVRFFCVIIDSCTYTCVEELYESRLQNTKGQKAIQTCFSGR